LIYFFSYLGAAWATVILEAGIFIATIQILKSNCLPESSS